jgi:hypothetical protein
MLFSVQATVVANDPDFTIARGNETRTWISHDALCPDVNGECNCWHCESRGLDGGFRGESKINHTVSLTFSFSMTSRSLVPFSAAPPTASYK